MPEWTVFTGSVQYVRSICAHAGSVHGILEGFFKTTQAQRYFKEKMLNIYAFQ